MSSSKLTLETLPIDVIVEMLFSFDNYTDLRALIGASAVFYRHFSRYSGPILTQVAKNIIGNAWGEASAVLVYQRNFAKMKCSDFSTVKKELEEGFVLQPTDIRLLVANQLYFDRCCESFPDFLVRHCPKPTDQDYKPLAYLYVPLAQPPPENPDTSLSFEVGDTFPIKLFYQTWLLSLQFTFDNFTTLACREQHISPIDLWVASRIMFISSSGVGSISGFPIWDLTTPGEKITHMFIDKWGRQGKFRRVLHNQNLKDLVRMKASLCFRGRCRSGVQFWTLEKQLVKDYKSYKRGEITLGDFSGKYRLDEIE